MIRNFIIGMMAGGLIYIIATSAHAQTATISPTQTPSPSVVVPSQAPSTGFGN